MENKENIVALIPQPLKRGPGRPPKHGAYSKYALAAITDTKIAEIRQVMAGEKLATAPTDTLFITVLGRLLAQMELLDRYYQLQGLFQNEGRGLVWPSVPHYLNLAKQAGRMLEQLGMTPAARYRLGREALQSEDIASKILRARQQ